MTVMELNTEIYRSLMQLSADENYLKKAAASLRKLVKQKEAEEAAYQSRSKQELTNDFEQALQDVKLYKEGKVPFKDAECLIDEL